MTATCFENTAAVETEIIVATFGEAALIKRPQGGYALAGGSSNDRIEAKEWISLFLHEALIRDN